MKPTKQELLELIKWGNQSNVIMKSTETLQSLSQELNLLEVDSDLNVELLEKIVVFPFNSDKLVQSIRMIKQKEVMQAQIGEIKKCLAREEVCQFSLDIIQKIIQSGKQFNEDIQVISEQYKLATKINQRIHSIKSQLGLEQCKQIQALMEKCYLTCPEFKQFERRVEQYLEIKKALEESITEKEVARYLAVSEKEKLDLKEVLKKKEAEVEKARRIVKRNAALTDELLEEVGTMARQL